MDHGGGGKICECEARAPTFVPISCVLRTNDDAALGVNVSVSVIALCCQADRESGTPISILYGS